jgi:aspartate racemase
MKTIGLLGGTGWSSTIDYYRMLNQLVNDRLGGYHSAKILLKSIDYHFIMSHYGKDHHQVADALYEELTGLIALKPDCILICCNSLHKYYDLIQERLNSSIPIIHALDLVAQYAQQKKYSKVLLLATKFTMEDGFFEKKIEEAGVDVMIPTLEERDKMQAIHAELMQNVVTDAAKKYFSALIRSYKEKGAEAVMLGCTEYPLVVHQDHSALPIIDPVRLQTAKAVEYALG